MNMTADATHMRGVKPYPPKMRTLVRKTIKRLVREGNSYKLIAEALAKEGIKTPKGTTPTAQFVGNQITRIRSSGTRLKRRRRTATRRTTPRVAMATTRTTTTLRKPAEVVLSVLTDPTLNDAVKVQMLCSYYQI